MARASRDNQMNLPVALARALPCQSKQRLSKGPQEIPHPPLLINQEHAARARAKELYLRCSCCVLCGTRGSRQRERERERAEQDVGFGVGRRGGAAGAGGRRRVRHVQGGRPRRLGHPAGVQARRLQELVQVHQIQARRRNLVPVPADPGLGAPGDSRRVPHLRPVVDAAAQARRRQLRLQPHQARPRLLHQRRAQALPQGPEALGRRAQGRRQPRAAQLRRPCCPRAHPGGLARRDRVRGPAGRRALRRRRRAALAGVPGGRRRRIHRRRGCSFSAPVILSLAFRIPFH